jgi:hypothetical protein
MTATKGWSTEAKKYAVLLQTIRSVSKPHVARHVISGYMSFGLSNASQ